MNNDDNNDHNHDHNHNTIILLVIVVMITSVRPASQVTKGLFIIPSGRLSALSHMLTKVAPSGVKLI